MRIGARVVFWATLAGSAVMPGESTVPKTPAERVPFFVRLEPLSLLSVNGPSDLRLSFLSQKEFGDTLYLSLATDGGLQVRGDTAWMIVLEGEGKYEATLTVLIPDKDTSRLDIYVGPTWFRPATRYYFESTGDPVEMVTWNPAGLIRPEGYEGRLKPRPTGGMIRRDGQAPNRDLITKSTSAELRMKNSTRTPVLAPAVPDQRTVDSMRTEIDYWHDELLTFDSLLSLYEPISCLWENLPRIASNKRITLITADSNEVTGRFLAIDYRRSLLTIQELYDSDRAGTQYRFAELSSVSFRTAGKPRPFWMVTGLIAGLAAGIWWDDQESNTADYYARRYD
ncbi:MAG: hypothetical protein JSU65_05840, partial [Candidatus Zixiibacteriota bacterium]